MCISVRKPVRSAALARGQENRRRFLVSEIECELAMRLRQELGAETDQQAAIAFQEIDAGQRRFCFRQPLPQLGQALSQALGTDPRAGEAAECLDPPRLAKIKVMNAVDCRRRPDETLFDPRAEPLPGNSDGCRQLGDGNLLLHGGGPEMQPGASEKIGFGDDGNRPQPLQPPRLQQLPRETAILPQRPTLLTDDQKGGSHRDGRGPLPACRTDEADGRGARQRRQPTRKGDMLTPQRLGRNGAIRRHEAPSMKAVSFEGSDGPAEKQGW